MYGYAGNGHYRTESGQKQRTYSLEGYISLADKRGDGTPRAITAEDLEVICLLRTRYQDMNVLIADVLTVSKVLKRLGDKRVFAITNNLFRIVNSLHRQRNLVYATLKCFKKLKPEAYEMGYIRDLCDAVAERVKFLREKILPENISLTPIAEYLEESGSVSLTDDVFKQVGNRQRLAELMRSGEHDEAIERYVAHILEVVERAGTGKRYEERVAKWYARSEKIRAAKEAEQELAQNERDLQLAEDGLRQFRQAFLSGVDKVEGRDDIGLPQQTLEKVILRGRGKWVILRCEHKYGKLMKRYYTEKGDWNKRGFNAKAFAGEDECRQALGVLRRAEPWKAYDMVKI